MGKKKRFYDEYDALFTKPNARVKIQEGSFATTVGKLKSELSSAAVAKKGKPNRKNRSVNKKNKRFVWTGIIVAAVLVMMGIYGSTLPDDYDDEYDEDRYTDIRPLQDAGLKRTGTIDLSQPLVISVDEKTLHFNKGYSLEIKGDVDIENLTEELSVLPTDKEYPTVESIAWVKFYSGREYLRGANIGMSGNLIVSMYDYLDNREKATTFTKAYPVADIGDVQTGYVVDYDGDEEYVYVGIQRYFIFPDGTGIWLETNSDILDRIELHPDDSFETIKKAYSEDFKFLEDSFLFTQDTEKQG